MALSVQGTTQGHTLRFGFSSINVCGLERILYNTPTTDSTLFYQMNERRGAVYYAQAKFNIHRLLRHNRKRSGSFGIISVLSESIIPFLGLFDEVEAVRMVEFYGQFDSSI